MLGYGFSIPDNPFDHYAVGFTVPQGSPLAEARAWRATQSAKANKKGKMEDNYRYYIFNAEHPRAKSARCLETSIFSHDLFESISILSANFRELQGDRFTSTGSVLQTDAKGAIDRRQHRNLLHTLSQLRLECSNRSLLLRADAPGLENSSTIVTSQKQQYARVYRDSQLLITETAALLCRYCLLRAQNHHAEDDDLISSAAAAEHIHRTSQATINVQKLLDRMHSTICVRTLFNFSDLATLLPAKLASKIHSAAASFSRAVREKAHFSLPTQSTICNELQEKVKFSVLLAALRKVYSERSVVLPNQLKSWMKDLQKWYPFVDPFWNGPIEEFLPTLETLMEAADLITPDTDEPVMDEVWSDPHMLCWGWNVQEEEGLFSDSEAQGSADGGTVHLPSTYLLCIPGRRETN